MAFSSPQNGSAGKLTVRFEGIEKAGGTVHLAMYARADEFMQEDKATLYSFKADKKGKLEAAIENLPTGSYAFAVFFDENNNKKLDKNLVGVPVEPYGFSKNPTSKWRLPNWEEVKFEMNTSTKSLDVSLKRWALF
jgi:uncharacterized protein (DUF2141 family)